MKVYIKTYGCQMNKYDSELVAGILSKNDFTMTDSTKDADVLLVNTCSVREHAENRMLGNLTVISNLKRKKQDLIIGVIGCTAVRLNEEIIEKVPAVDFVAGPDHYRNLPELLKNVSLFDEKWYGFNNGETYENVTPLRKKGVSAWIAIMRGCNNFCSYCVVPYVRGRERSRTLKSIRREITELLAEGFKEVTLLGQNVNSYHDGEHHFPDLLENISEIEGLRRIRFATSHPKDLSSRLIEVIAKNDAVCNHIHLPVQSGSDRVLRAMNRGYTREGYFSLIEKIKKAICDVAITTDIITGFPGETREDHRETLDLVKKVEFDSAFVFKYSPREGTKAANFKDDVSENTKIERIKEINQIQQSISERKNRDLIGETREIMIEGSSRRSENELKGKLEVGKGVIVKEECNNIKAGDFVNVKITDANSKTLFGKLIK